MSYLLLVKMPQNPDNLNNLDGWAVQQLTPHEEVSVEWEEMFSELKEAGEIEDFLVVGIGRHSLAADEVPYRVKGGITKV